MWRDENNFDAHVKASWEEAIYSTPMYKVVKNLKRLKRVLLDINKEGFNDIQVAEVHAKQILLACQDALQHDPLNGILIDKEKEARGKYIQLRKACSMFLAQKAKSNWIHLGDENTAFFHASLKARRAHNRINSIKNGRVIWVDNSKDVKADFLDYYQELLGTTMTNRLIVIKAIVEMGLLLSTNHIRILQADFTQQEVKGAFYAILGMKALGPDGYGSFFFQDNWDLVGSEVCDVVLSFLRTGNLLK
ncbi:uncharacterized protein LOC133791985 [Humulus lupulus]|uniref:uncharacterized protein LOC133791985 n=1 Tax=Humulus lupulus TaxID=3486 RepID=UPI002B4069FC|nr:uncharacterized protein LOC133791985 [Humulus lupulus]